MALRGYKIVAMKLDPIENKHPMMMASFEYGKFHESLNANGPDSLRFPATAGNAEIVFSVAREPNNGKYEIDGPDGKKYVGEHQTIHNLDTFKITGDNNFCFELGLKRLAN